MAETLEQANSAPIAASFARAKAERRVALIPYVMAGYPDEATSEELVVALAAAGADVIELGVPFSDPLADGATIQHASQQALDSGMTLARALAVAERAAQRIRQNRQDDPHGEPIAPPLVMMGYYNPIFSYGIARFCADAAAAGVAGLIVPDLPPEEAETLRSAAADQGIELIFLVTPTSPQERIAQVATMAGKTGGGFVYCVSISGVTGARNRLPEELGAFIARVRATTHLPLAIGFGVSKPEHVAEIGQVADGAVVASAIINTLDAAPADERIAAVVAFLRSLQQGAQATHTG
ncbi:MAG: tryptophan synthase subunit alpha [Ktedonobacterales bacterium]